MRTMPVFVLSVMIITTGFSAQALSKEKECELQSAIVKRAVELRMERKSEKKALEMMTSGQDAAVAEKYLASVPAVVDWIYSGLKRKELKLDPGKAYYEACIAQ
ncbi:hypothetical protein [Pseudopelagicola sp. nBUS_19]|uniref:hypothetical protein n=1 Tax=unclassified Pseudopelagicola TaxID=2649563 RepID=UPI003EBEC104